MTKLKFLQVLVSILLLFGTFIGANVLGADQANSSDSITVDWPVISLPDARLPLIAPGPIALDKRRFMAAQDWISNLGSKIAGNNVLNCKSPFDDICKSRSISFSRNKWGSKNQLPICISQQEKRFCFEKPTLLDSKGHIIELIQDGEVDGPSWPANLDFSSPSAEKIQVWRSASDDSLSGYVLKAMIDVNGSFSTKKTTIDNLSISFLRFQLKPLNNSISGNVQTVTPSNCLWIETRNEIQYCSHQLYFPEGITLNLVLHLSKDLTGWLSGRLEDPIVEVNKIGEDFNSLSISAKPTSVPVFGGDVPCGILRNIKCGTGLNMPFGQVPDANELNSIATTFGDKSNLEVPMWTFSSINPVTKSKCTPAAGKFAGLVFSNSTFATTEPPKFIDGTLNYKLGALHYKSDGNVFKGRYTLLVESRFARCLWKLSSAPVMAKITVVGTSDEKIISTTLINENGGYIKLGVDNFTFSIPTVKVLLLQK